MGTKGTVTDYTPRFLELVESMAQEFSFDYHAGHQIQTIIDLISEASVVKPYKDCIRFALDQADHSGSLTLSRFWVQVLESLLMDADVL